MSIGSQPEEAEQSLAPGSQTFEQDLFRLYREGTITLEEALANADSPTNLSWLINNSQINAPAAIESLRALNNSGETEGAAAGASFTEFTLNMDD